MKNKNYPCAACQGTGKTIIQPGNLEIDCGYCDGEGCLPSQWWYESVIKRCGKFPLDGVQQELGLINYKLSGRK